MFRILLALTLLCAPLLLVPAVSADHGGFCYGDDRFLPIGDAYVMGAQTQSGRNGVRVLEFGITDGVVSWQRGVRNEAYLESNGVPGLQVESGSCSHPDTLLVRLYTGTGGASIPL